MDAGRRCARALATALVVAFVVLTGAGAALAEGPRPTVDPTAPTPTSPYPGRPPQGEAPDGSTVGGERLGTRGVVVAGGAPPLPAGITAPTWLVADAGTGEVLAACDPHGRFYPASTLKTLTLLTLLPVLDPAQVVVGTVEDENIEGTRVGLVEGGHYPVQLLYEALMLASGNDAANALARAAGGANRTVTAMNATAAALGAFDTVAGTPSGLDVAGQSSSVYDLALIFRALLDRPRAAAVLRTPTAQMPAIPNRSPGYQIQNKNPLLSSYPGNLGAKNGFTHAARHGFVTAAERGGRRIVVSVLGSEAVPLRAPEQAARLLDWGFSVPAGTHGVGRLIDPAEAPGLAAAPSIPRHDDGALTPSPAVGHLDTDVNTDLDADVETGPATPMIPVVLGALVLLTAGAIQLARRHALRSAAASPPPPVPPTQEGSPPPPSGASPSTPQ
ncbi:MAG: peptidase D-alanyl-D-alanine carboxypeptidase 1 [Blastococcus sp.]|nr:peptidase D-alanyl-D-alanine carboxypeptidase 1 [Blastococcus sp.]